MKPLDEQSRRLIAEATASDLPAPGREAEIWQSLVGRLDAPLPPSAAAASQAGGAATASLGAKLILSFVATGVLLGGTAVWYVRESAVPARQPAGVTTITAPVSPQPQFEPEPGPEITTPEPPSALSAETELLAAAQRALNSDAPARALALLDRHRVQFTDGLLTPERDAARILALCALGRVDQAQRARKQFLRDHPDSPHRSRIRAGCK